MEEENAISRKIFLEMIIDVEVISRKRLGAKCFGLFLDFAVIIIKNRTEEYGFVYNIY